MSEGLMRDGVSYERWAYAIASRICDEFDPNEEHSLDVLQEALVDALCACPDAIDRIVDETGVIELDYFQEVE